MKKILNFFKNLFAKDKENPAFNLHHPDVRDNVEFAFEVGGKKYYRFSKDYKCPTGRFKYIDAFLYEAELRMNLKMLNAYCDKMLKELDGAAGQVRISELIKVVWAIQSRCKLAFSPETIERLASVVYFDETEDLSDYNEEHGNKKIALWKKHDFIGFFLTTPIIELLNLKGFSEESFRIYLQEIREAELLIKDLTLEPGKGLLANT